MKKESNKGVTLIALIITIIVLLILAGITLAMVVGDNGIIAKAGTAKKVTNDSQQDEENRLNDYENKISEYSIGSRSNVETVTAYTATTYNANISLGDYDISNYDYLLMTGYNGDFKRTTIEPVFDIRFGTTKIGLTDDYVGSWYRINSDKKSLTCTQNEKGTYVVTAIVLIKIK